MIGLSLLTHSRQDAFKTCRKKAWFSYEQGIRPTTDAKALRMGSAYHGALEILMKGGTLAEAVYFIRRVYQDMPGHYDAYEWDIEAETVIRLVCGYIWRWSNQTIEVVATEQTFVLPLVNLETGQPSRTFQLAGKIDGIIRLEDGRLSVMEHKLLGEDLGTDGSLWKRLRIDHQISLYTYAARQLGYPVEGVTYNVTRKPTIAATPVPCPDENGVKVVVDAHGERIKNKNGTWKQTADTANGYTLLTRPMTTNEWGEKLIADIQERPDFYYVRQEITRLDSDLAECMAELWDIAKTIRDAQINNRWYRTVNKSTCSFCQYFNLCTENSDLKTLPQGFERVVNIHPELGDLANGSPAPDPPPETAAPAAVSGTADAAAASRPEWSGDHAQQPT